MKIIALGDTHGTVHWKEVIKNNTFDKLVFTGDYFDSHEDIAAHAQLDNFNDIVALKKTNPNRVVLLFGNHDFHYLKDVSDEYSGFQPRYRKKFSELLQPLVDDGILQMCYVHNQYVFTHAGITKTWCRANNADIRNLEASINELFIHNPGAFKFTAGKNRSANGDDITQSPIWVRQNSLYLDGIGNYIQIVGHTPQHKLLLNRNVRINNKPVNRGDVIFIDTLGTSHEFLIIKNGKMLVGKI